MGTSRVRLFSSLVGAGVVVGGLLGTASGCGATKTKKRVVVGLALPQSGALTTGELYPTSAALALSHIKAGGGVLDDAELALEQADTQTTALGAEAAVTDLLGKGAKAVVAVTSSEIISIIENKPRGAGPLAAASSVPLMCLGCTAPDFEAPGLQAAFGAKVDGADPANPAAGTITASGYVYRMLQRNTPQGVQLAQMAASDGTRAAALAIDLNFGKALVGQGFAPSWATLGKTFVRLSVHSPVADAAAIGAAFDAAVADVDGQPIDVLVVNSLPAANQAVAAAYAASTKKPKLFFSFTGYSTELLSAAGNALVGAKGVAYGIGRGPNPGTFVADYARLRGITEEQVKTSIYVDQAYDAVMLLALAVTSVGKVNPTGAELKAALDTLNTKGGVEIGYNEFKKAKEALSQGQKIDYRGVSGDLDFNLANGVLSTLIQWQVGLVGGQPQYQELP